MLSISLDIDFAWERPAKAKGFTWQETDDGMTHLVRVEGVPFERYQPLRVRECTGLFRTFAGLAPDPAALLGFANRYGNLGSGWDTLGFWKEGIRRLNALVATWDALLAEDWAALRTRFAKLPPALFQALAQSGTEAKRAGRSELVNAAVHLLYREVGGRLFGWTFGAWSRQQTPPVVWHPDAKQPVLKLTPPSLMDAIYLQFARAILGNKSYQTCQACGRWFELAPGVNRADRQTCSPYCRVKLYRLRQRRACDLHEQGWTVKRISKELGSTVLTVKKWLSQNKE
jgi:hypothetical protein